MFVQEGARAVEALLKSPIEILHVLHLPVDNLGAPVAERLKTIRFLAEKRGVAVREAARREIAHYFSSKTPQGIAAIARFPPESSIEEMIGEETRILVLDGLNDPGNTGTLLRTAHLLGWNAIVSTPGTVSLFTPKAVRAAAGAIGFVRHARSTAEKITHVAQSAGLEIFEAVAAGGEAVPSANPERCALILGGEARGAASGWPGSRRISLPTKPSAVDSLSVATSGAILLYLLGR